MRGLLLALGVVTAVPFSTAASPKDILACQLEDGSQVQLKSEADPARGGERFYLRRDGITEDAFVDIPGADYVGNLVLSKCLDHVLIFAINYGTPYFKGRLLRKPAGAGQPQNINFAEKSLPILIYLNKWETKLVIPNTGYEVTSKYLVYRSLTNKGQDERALPTDSLPNKNRHRVIQITP